MSPQEKSVAELCSFFIFNSMFSQCEGEEHLKVIYYHPKSSDVNTQMKDVGLVEALVQFARTFNSDAPVHCMQTMKQKHFYLEPEKDFFMVMVVRHPVVSVTSDNTPHLEYVPDDVSDTVCLSLLRRMYLLYRLLHGAMAADSREQLIDKTAAIFDSYLPQLRLPQRNITDVYWGVRFLPLDKLAFLRLQSFVNQLEVQYTFVKHTVLYYKHHLVWSGLGRTNMAVVNDYLSTVLLPECGADRSGWRHQQTATGGIFMSTEASSGDQASAFLMPPVVHLRKHKCVVLPLDVANGSRDGDDSVEGETEEEADEREQMVIYTLGDVTVVLFVDVEVPASLQLCRQLDSTMAPRLHTISSELAKSLADRPASAREDSDARVIYYNRCNLAQKCNLLEEAGRSGAAPKDACQLIVDLRDDTLRLSRDGGCVFGRTQTDAWVAGRVTADREFFAVLQQKNMNLMDVNDEMAQLCEEMFASIFFLP